MQYMKNYKVAALYYVMIPKKD